MIENRPAHLFLLVGSERKGRTGSASWDGWSTLPKIFELLGSCLISCQDFYPWSDCENGQRKISEHLPAGRNCYFLSFKCDFWFPFHPHIESSIITAVSVSHSSLFDFPINWEAVLLPFVALVSLVPPISQSWDPAKSQSQSVLYKVRMCLHSYKHEDMIKTCFRRGEDTCV